MGNRSFDLVIVQVANLKQHVLSALGKGFVTKQLRDIELRIDNLAFEFSDFNNYELFVNAWGTSEQTFEVQLSDHMAELVTTGQSKLAKERTKQETAALVLLASEAHEVCEAELGYCPDLTPKNVSIGKIIPYS
ncbi:MAG: hypothetical protein JWN75_129 [Candidatus Saccharibacteria bacterium]|nr:hypothetical protein [Candidatus Saccharibacteria bacterium]